MRTGLALYLFVTVARGHESHPCEEPAEARRLPRLRGRGAVLSLPGTRAERVYP